MTLPGGKPQRQIVETFFATAARGTEECVEREIRDLAARYAESKIKDIRRTRAGVEFKGTLQAGYLACLWLRTASRVLLKLSEFDAYSPEELYDGVADIDWSQHLKANQSLAVDCGISRSNMTHSHYGALKTKDAIVDQFMDHDGIRPGVDLKNPDVRINVYVLEDYATLSIDLSGALHERGYRTEMTAAPLKENLAAALLLTAGFRESFEAGGTLVDPMCGSGTLPIEALGIALDVAPGLDRKNFGFLRWKGHDSSLWASVFEDAKKRAAAGFDRAYGERKGQFPFIGFDEDANAIRIASDTMLRMGFEGLVHFERRELSLAAPPADKKGIVICNPPYGERLGEEAALKGTYRKIGDLYKQKFKGWEGFVFTGSVALSKEVGLKADKKTIFFNGPIECRLLQFSLY